MPEWKLNTPTAGMVGMAITRYVGFAFTPIRPERVGTDQWVEILIIFAYS